MRVQKTKLDGVLILNPVVHQDDRGYFMESYNKKTLEQHGLEIDFIQDNQALSLEAGVLRGLHYQLNPMAQTKLVRVCSGAVYDVIVDIRRNSPTFGEWIGVTLSEENKRQVLVPQGFAHGYCTLVPNTIVFYKVDQYYSPEHDRGIYWADPEIGIDWPTLNPTLSSKDSQLPMLRNAELNFS